MEVMNENNETSLLQRQVYEGIFARCKEALSAKLPDGAPKHVNLCTVLSEWIGPEEEATHNYSAQLQALEGAIFDATGGFDANAPKIHTTVPLPGSQSQPLLVTVALSQLGFLPDAGMKGPSPSSDVLDCISKFVMSGNETSKYPLEVLYMMNVPLVTGSPVESFSIGLNVGFAVTTACHIIGQFIVTKYHRDEYGQVEFWRSDDRQELAQKLRTCLRMSATYAPANDIVSQVFSCISAKKQATLRQGPNLLQLLFAMDRIIQQKVRQGSRKSYSDHLNECVKIHQQKERVSRAKLTTDEIRGLKIVSKLSDKFKTQLAAIWGTDKLQYTAVPLDLIASQFLDLHGDVPVTKAANPVWFAILSKTPEKLECWLKRVNDKFEHELDSRMSGGRSVCLRNQGHLLRDKKEEQPIVFRICCMWVEALPDITKHNDKARFQHVQKQFFCGLLDQDFRPHAICMDVNYKPDVLRFARQQAEDKVQQ